MDTMRFITWNVNGLRSVVRGDFEAWLSASDYDVVCLQETKVEEDLLTGGWFEGYETFWNPSERPGHGGVATLVRRGLPARFLGAGVGDAELDREGRVLRVEVGGIQFVNVYAPHSHRKLLRRDAKERFLNALRDLVDVERDRGAPLVLLGDFNVAHGDGDLANPRANKGNAGFLPEERAWVDHILANGFVDAFRRFETGSGHYTWWSMREGVRERNVGWRLDYVFVEAALAEGLINCRHLPGRNGSDHCPVEAELSTLNDVPELDTPAIESSVYATVIGNSPSLVV